SHAQQFPQLLPRIGLDRLLPKNVVASCKGSEQLTVQVVSVSQHDNGRIVQLSNELARIEDHCQGFAATLGVPDYPRLLVALSCLFRRPESLVRRPVLMIGSEFLHRRFVLFKDNEVSYDVNKPVLLTHSS